MCIKPLTPKYPSPETASTGGSERQDSFRKTKPLTSCNPQKQPINLTNYKIGDTLKTRDGRPVVLTALECEGIWLGQIDRDETWYYLEDGKAFDPLAYCGNPWPEDIVGEWRLYDTFIRKLRKTVTYIRSRFHH